MNSLEWGIAAGIFSIGGLFGALGGGRIGAKIGRKATLWYKNIFFILGGLVMALSLNNAMLYIGRFLVGVGSGVATAAAPTYIAEVSPTNYRGTLGALHQLAVVVAILVSQLLGLLLSNIPGWRILLGLTVVPSLVQMLLLPVCVESPRFLVSQGLHEKARQSLQKLRGVMAVEDELDGLIMSIDREGRAGVARATVFDLVRTSALKKALVIAVVAQVAQQLSGINGVIIFSSSIFKRLMGESEEMSNLLTVIVGLVNLVITIISVFLMDRLGRRALLLFSQYGMAAISIIIVGGSLLNLDVLIAVGVMVFVAIFAIGLGPIPWLILPEIFPSSAVGPAASVCVSINWLCSFLIGFLFDFIQGALGAFTFLPFAVISLICALIMTFMLPETKGRSVDEVTELLQ